MLGPHTLANCNCKKDMFETTVGHSSFRGHHDLLSCYLPMSLHCKAPAMIRKNNKSMPRTRLNTSSTPFQEIHTAVISVRHFQANPTLWNGSKTY
eukprot:480288-Amphidinium_carterae.1